MARLQAVPRTSPPKARRRMRGCADGDGSVMVSPGILSEPIRYDRVDTWWSGTRWAVRLETTYRFSMSERWLRSAARSRPTMGMRRSPSRRAPTTRPLKLPAAEVATSRLVTPRGWPSARWLVSTSKLSAPSRRIRVRRWELFARCSWRARPGHGAYRCCLPRCGRRPVCQRACPFRAAAR